MLKEFRDFIMRGNVIDLAVAVIIGGAFGAIVTSFIEDILMPIIGIFLGGVDFSGLTFQVGNAVIAYGNFIQVTVNFLVIALVIFLIMRTYTNLQKKEEEEAAEAPPEPTKEEILLAEIRDLLKEQKS